MSEHQKDPLLTDIEALILAMKSRGIQEGSALYERIRTVLDNVCRKNPDVLVAIPEWLKKKLDESQARGKNSQPVPPSKSWEDANADSLRDFEDGNILGVDLIPSIQQTTPPPWTADEEDAFLRDLEALKSNDGPLPTPPMSDADMREVERLIQRDRFELLSELPPAAQEAILKSQKEDQPSRFGFRREPQPEPAPTTGYCHGADDPRLAWLPDFLPIETIPLSETQRVYNAGWNNCLDEVRKRVRERIKKNADVVETLKNIQDIFDSYETALDVMAEIGELVRPFIADKNDVEPEDEHVKVNNSCGEIHVADLSNLHKDDVSKSKFYNPIHIPTGGIPQIVFFDRDGLVYRLTLVTKRTPFRKEVTLYVDGIELKTILLCYPHDPDYSPPRAIVDDFSKEFGCLYTQFRDSNNETVCQDFDVLEWLTQHWPR